MSDIRIEIRIHEKPSLLKVVWSETVLSFPPYYVDAGIIRHVTKQLREALGAMVDDSMRSPSDGRFDDAALRQLASLGRNLYESLFIDAGGSEIDPTRIQHWFEQRSDVRLTISVDSRIHIPWGLVFSGDPAVANSQQSDAGRRVDPSFWCLKHKLATVHWRVTPDRVDLPYSRQTLTILPVVNRRAYERAVAALSDGERQLLLDLQQQFGAPAYRSSEFEDRWGTSVAMLYFYCHANGTKLELASDDVLDAVSLQFLFGRTGSSRKEPCVVFLNGCSTATGHQDGAFLEATGQPGMCGFIGTETIVPDVFALRFSIAFLSQFLKGGRPVADIMHELWLQHFPLSLVYSVYTYPLLQVEAPVVGAGLPPPADVEENYSYGTLGSATL